MGKVELRRVVIDTNVVISALLFGGTPGKLLPLWKSGRIQPLASKEMIDEYLRALAHPKFQLSEEEINFILYQEILPYFEPVKAKPGRVIIRDDPSDDKFIRCAQSGKALIIISGDEHLIALKSYRNIRILSPFQFLDELR
ncbi:MAG: putative toxin-antitoxin system toxin component, PIN family [candidate division Zixibacteria bacterium]|nr:putative toxin-antitoxin system toxin component, PIN family [candidate division Zixibacteria bacterium]